MDWADTGANVLWAAYQTAQASADHTDKQCFVEVISQGLRKVAKEHRAKGIAEGIERAAEWIVDHHAIDPWHRKALSDAIRALKEQGQSDEG